MKVRETHMNALSKKDRMEKQRKIYIYLKKNLANIPYKEKNLHKVS